MSVRTAAWLAWSLAAVSLVLLLAGITLSYLSRSAVLGSADAPTWLEYALTAMFTTPTLGRRVCCLSPSYERRRMAAMRRGTGGGCSERRPGPSSLSLLGSLYLPRKNVLRNGCRNALATVGL